MVPKPSHEIETALVARGPTNRCNMHGLNAAKECFITHHHRSPLLHDRPTGIIPAVMQQLS